MGVKRSDLDNIRQNQARSSNSFKFEPFDAQYSEFGCPFRDKFIDVKNNNMHLRWYKKNNPSTKLLNFNSSPQFSWKKINYFGHCRRILDSCTTSEGLNLDILNTVYNEILKQNGYANYFIRAQKSRLQQMIEGVQSDCKNKLSHQNKLLIKIPFQHQTIFNELEKTFI